MVGKDAQKVAGCFQTDVILNTILEAFLSKESEVLGLKLLQQKKKSGKNLAKTIKECLIWLKD